MGVLVLFQILVGGLSAFLHWLLYLLCICLNGFYYGKVCSLYTHFGKGYDHESMFGLVKCFFLHLLRWSCGFWLFFCYCSVWRWLICIYWAIRENLGWITLGCDVWSFILCCWIQWAKILLRIFVSKFIKAIGLYFSFW